MAKKQKNELHYTGKLRFVRTSWSKAGQVLKLIRGKSYSEAVFILQHTNKKASRLILKLIRSIGANARNRMEEERPNLEDLYVSRATADQGPTYPARIMYRAYGRATRIRKRSSHITITLTEHQEATAARIERQSTQTRKKK